MTYLKQFNQTDYDAADSAILYFTADRCPRCKQIKPLIEEVAKKIYAIPDASLYIAEVNLDEEPQLGTDFQIMSLPTLLIAKPFHIVIGHGNITSQEIDTMLNVYYLSADAEWKHNADKVNKT